MNQSLWRIAVAVLFSSTALAALAAEVGTPCEKLQALTIAQVSVTAAGVVAAGMFTPPGAKTPLNVREFCRVEAISRPTDDSEIKFEVWIPTTWNGKFQGNGVGGYDGSIPYAAMATALERGYAATGNDLGHTGGDLKFGEGHPEKVIDWAHRAMHVTAVASKLIVRNRTGVWPAYSYFVGCSSGGHQGLSEAQRYPDDYDGIVVGDPGYDRVRQTASYLWYWKALHGVDGTPLVTPAHLRLVTQSAIAACDADDGVKDGVIDDPRHCAFDPASLLCKGPASESCLTGAQADAIKKVHAGLIHPRTGEVLFPGFSLGSEAFGTNQGWNGFLVAPTRPMRSEVYNYFLFNDPNWDFRTFDFDKDVAYADRKLAHMAAVDPDLTAFRARGGKIVMYTGWADPVAAPLDVIKYYDAVTAKMGGGAKTEEFFRFFMAPGMGHCGGGYGPNSFDMLTELENWVEKGAAPRQVIASLPVDGKTVRTRPLCPYPQVARWSGKGSTDEAASFACRAPPRR